MEIEIAVLVSIDVKAAHDIQLALGHYDPLHSPKAWTLNFECTTAQSLKNRCFRAILRRFEFQRVMNVFLDGAPRFFGCSWKVLNGCDTQNSPALTDRGAKTPQKTLHDAKYALEYVQRSPHLRPNPGVLARAPHFFRCS